MIKKELTIEIGLYRFKLKFFTLTNEKWDGLTKYNDRTIDIRDDLDDTATMLLIRHEIVHAILCTQGRYLQKKFDVEEMCEFIAYKLPEINEICEEIETKLEVCTKYEVGKND